MLEDGEKEGVYPVSAAALEARPPRSLISGSGPFGRDHRAVGAAPLGPDIELCTNRHNHPMVRPPASGEVYWHRDAVVWSRPIVTVLAYLDESTLENGCLCVVPGSHRSPWPIDQRLHSADDQARVAKLVAQGVPCPMPAGGLLITHGCLLHGPARTVAPARGGR
ncbi:MAG: phytanoyl-CoA dioxygenase family protein [Gammaproteobacteria bacterium]|nr:phytanoyl-CoA dioxygenase family protein [Gammaproteobacteria bacterium]